MVYRILKLIIAGEDVAEAEEGFALCLESELAKVESFFRLKEGNFASQLKQLAKRVAVIEEGIAGGSECDNLVDMLKLLEGHSDLAQLLKDLLSFASAIDDLREFVFANVQATIKITKKVSIATPQLSCPPILNPPTHPPTQQPTNPNAQTRTVFHRPSCLATCSLPASSICTFHPICSHLARPPFRVNSLPNPPPLCSTTSTAGSCCEKTSATSCMAVFSTLRPY